MTAAGSGPRWRIEDVLARSRLDDLLDELAGASERVGAGRRWHCPAPDHDDHRASVTMHSDRHGHERWRCWSGDHRGDAIDLVMLRKGGSRSEAIDWLAMRAGIIPDGPLPPIPAKPRPAPPSTTMDPAVERYVRVCAAVLWGRQGRPVRDWLQHRGFDEATMHANLVGCDPGRQLMRRRRGLPYGAVPAATFPALGPSGQVTFVQARYLDAGTAGRKYDGAAAALAPNPRLSFAVTPSPQWALLVVCEGIPDALTAAQAGYRAAGLLGSQAPDESVAARLAGYAEQHRLDVVVMCDADEAGRAGGERLAELLAAERVDPTLVEPPQDVLGADDVPVVDLNAWARLNSNWATDLNHALSVPETPLERSAVADCSVGVAIDD